jgi:hypothetical protein
MLKGVKSIFINFTIEICNFNIIKIIIVKQIGLYDNLIKIIKTTNKINRFNNKRTF